MSTTTATAPQISTVRRTPQSDRLGKYWPPLAFGLAMVVLWWLATALEWVPEYLVPSPARTWQAFAAAPAYFAEHTWITLLETLLGFAVAVVIGELVAVIMVYSKPVEQTLYPVVLFAQVIPKIAIAPLFVVWLGFGMTPKVVVAVLMAFFPVVISGLAGLRSVDPEMLELASTMGANKAKVFFKIRFPSSLPQLFSGLKVAATLAVTGAVVGEFVGANSGLGYVILQANGNIDTATLFVALIIMSAMGVALFALIAVLEKIFVGWHSSFRESGSTTVQA